MRLKFYIKANFRTIFKQNIFKNVKGEESKYCHVISDERHQFILGTFRRITNFSFNNKIPLKEI